MLSPSSFLSPDFKSRLRLVCVSFALWALVAVVWGVDLIARAMSLSSEAVTLTALCIFMVACLARTIGGVPPWIEAVVGNVLKLPSAFRWLLLTGASVLVANAFLQCAIRDGAGFDLGLFWVTEGWRASGLVLSVAAMFSVMDWLMGRLGEEAVTASHASGAHRYCALAFFLTGAAFCAAQIGLHFADW